MRKTINAVNLSDYTGIQARVYIPDLTNITSVAFYLATSSGFTKFGVKTVQKAELQEGWNTLVFGTHELAPTGGFTANDTVNTLQIRLNVAGAAEAYLDELAYVGSSTGNVVFTMDDNWKTQYTVAYPILSARGFKGNIAVIPSRVQTGGDTVMTTLELRQVHYDGWNLVNHTYNHNHLDTLDKETQRSELVDTRQWLLDNGLGTNGKYVIYPYGDYNQDTFDVMDEEGFVFGRSLSDGVSLTPYDRPLEIRQTNLTPGITVAKAKERIDSAIATGGTLIFTNHRFDEAEAGTGDTMFYDPNKYEEIVEYCKQKVDEGKLNVVTIDDLMEYNKTL